MKDNYLKISISILLIVFTVFSLTNIGNAASKATVNCPSSVELNKKFEVKLNLPSDATGIQAKVTVTFSDGSKKEDNIVYVSDPELNMTSDSPANFEAKVAGKATISITNILITKGEETIESGGSLTASINVNAPAVVNNPATNNAVTNTNVAPKDNAVTNTTTNSTTSTDTSTTSTNTSTTNTTTTSVTFKDVNETVYTNTKSNIRKNADKSSSLVATVSSGTKLTRTGVGSNGWSRVSYNGQTAYILSDLVTTTAPKEEEVTFKDANEKVYITSKTCNIRKSYSTSSDILGSASKGTELKRTGIGSNGWSRIEYKGQTAYISSKYVSTTKPEVDEEDTNEDNEEENTVDNNTITNEVIDENQAGGDKLEEIKNEVGVLPEVGINPAVIAYKVLTFVSIIGAIIVLYKHKKEI